MPKFGKLLLFSVLLLTAASFAVGQEKKAITKEEYDRALAAALEAVTYPFRETVKFAPYTDYDSAEAMRSDNGIKVSSKSIVMEVDDQGVLRITTETTAESGKTIVKQMQIDGDCYTLVGGIWKKNTVSCGGSMGLTAGRSPDKEEHFVEQATVDGIKQSIFRRIHTNGNSVEEAASFSVDTKGRISRQDNGFRSRTYEYGVAFPRVALPRKTRSTRTRR